MCWVIKMSILAGFTKLGSANYTCSDMLKLSSLILLEDRHYFIFGCQDLDQSSKGTISVWNSSLHFQFHTRNFTLIPEIKY